MKLSNLYIGSRQLFGFIAPGSVWVISLLVIFNKSTPISIISTFNGIDFFLFLSASFVLGTSIETISFNFSVTLSAFLHGAYVSREKNDFDYLPLDTDPKVIKHAREHAKDSKIRGFNFENMSDRDLSQFCRRYLLENTSYFKERINEYESEVNLLAMLVLPLVIFSLFWTITIFTISQGVPNNNPWVSWTKWSLPSLTVAGLFLYRLHPLRREEAESWMQMFSEHLSTISE